MTKHSILTILLLLGISFPHFTCEASKDKKVKVPLPGFIIRKAGDTLQTQILIDTSSLHYLIRCTESVSYLGSDGVEKVAVPDSILGFGFFLNSKKLLWLTRKYRFGNISSLNDQNRFLNAIVVGKVSLFKWWVSSSSSATHGHTAFERMHNRVKFAATFHPLWVYEKEGMPMKGIDVFWFKKRLRALINDCPAILAKSKEKKYNRKNFQPLIEEYNATCK